MRPTSSSFSGLSRSISTPRPPLPPFFTTPSPSSSSLTLSHLSSTPTPLSSLSAFNSRLSLSLPLPLLEQSLIHPSFYSSTTPTKSNFHSSSLLSNASLSSLGNSLLGTLTSELLLTSYPNLPTRVTKAATSLFVGPKTLASVAEKKWGIGPGRLERALVRGEGVGEERKMDRKERSYGHLVEGRGGGRKKSVFGEGTGGGGALVRWDRTPIDSVTDSILYEEVLASVPRALVGALHLTHGFSTTRTFVHRHFLSSLLSPSSLPSPTSTSQITPLLSFFSPTLILSRTLTLHSLPSPTYRLLKESGRLSAHPTFLVGVFSGDKKLGEGFGGSLKMARSRAAEDALRRVYLGGGKGVKGEGVPSDTWVDGLEEGFEGVRLGEVEAPDGSAR